MKMKIKRAAILMVATSIVAKTYCQDDGGKDFLSPFNVIGTKDDVSTLKGSGYVLR